MCNTNINMEDKFDTFFRSMYSYSNIVPEFVICLNTKLIYRNPFLEHTSKLKANQSKASAY